MFFDDNSALPPISIERIEYGTNQYEVGLLSVHKQTILLFSQARQNFLDHPQSCPEYWNALVNELNKLGNEQNSDQWLRLIDEWIHGISTLQNPSIEDIELKQHVDNNNLFQPTVREMECVIGYLQSSIDETNAWPILTQQLNKSSEQIYDANQWKLIVSHLLKRLTSRQQLIQRKLISPDWIRLSDVEHKLLTYLADEPDMPFNVRVSHALNQFQTHCRICLASNSSQMIDIFKEKQSDEITLLEKIRICRCFTTEPHINDGFPQKICLSCSILIENAYQLKMLCISTEQKFTEIISTSNNQKSIDNDLDPGEHFVKQPNALNLENFGPSIIEYHLHQTNGVTKSNESQNLVYSEENANLNLFDISNKRLICDYCQREFTSKQAISRHMATSHCPNAKNNTLFKCAECSKTFTKLKPILSHVKTHNKARPYSCNVCGKQFKTFSASKTHQVVHTQDKHFKCSHCTFTTTTKANLDIHLRIHSGIQPYNCPFCDMKFRTSSNMNKHKRNIHEKQRQHMCDICGQSFFSRESLRKHHYRHINAKRLKCPKDGCEFMYLWYNGLKKHFHRQHPSDNNIMPSEKQFYDDLSLLNS